MCSIHLGNFTKSSVFFPGFDKLVHCGFFFMVVVLTCTGSIKQQSPQNFQYKYIIVIMALAIIYGGVIEILQLVLFTWRTGEWDDLFADAIGAGMGAFSMLITVNAMRYVKK